MPIDVNIKKTHFSKQIYEAGTRAACEQFMHSIGYLLGNRQIRLDKRREDILFSLSPRELSDFNLVLHRGGEAEILLFLDSPRDATPRGGKKSG